MLLATTALVRHNELPGGDIPGVVIGTHISIHLAALLHLGLLQTIAVQTHSFQAGAGGSQTLLGLVLM